MNLTYDALDREIEIASGSTHSQVLYSPIGKLGLMNGQSATRIRIPLPGGSTAELLPGQTHILHADWLGSSRLSTFYSNRSLSLDTAYAPYGENYAGSGSTVDLSFTGQSQDTLSGLYDFLYREYSPVQGRWISPDPAGLSAVDLTNPQTFNRYAYVLNNPLSNIDPDGLDCVYLNNEDTSVQEVDHSSSFEECTGADANGNPNGGYWVDTYVDPTSVSVNSDTGGAVIPGQIVYSVQGGQLVESASAQDSTTVPGTNISVPQPALLISNAEQTMVHDLQIRRPSVITAPAPPKPPRPMTEEQKRAWCHLAVQARWSGVGDAPNSGADPGYSVDAGTTIYVGPKAVNPVGASAGQAAHAAADGLNMAAGKAEDMKFCMDHK